jgi:ketosteroid isomerase-like protein
MSTTLEVLDRHLKALEAADLAAIMDDYADDAVLLMGPQPAVGKAAIEQLFGAITASGPATMTEDARAIEGEIAYITWHTDQIAFGTDTFVVRDGKIVAQTVAMKF